MNRVLVPRDVVTPADAAGFPGRRRGLVSNRHAFARAGIRGLVTALLIAFVWPNAAAAGARSPYPAQFGDPSVFTAAIARAERQPGGSRPVTGLTVPHHLLAADLIASAFRLVDSRHVDKVVVLFPDHFKRSRTPFAVTDRAFETVFGRLDVNHADVSRLALSRRLVSRSDLFATEHGIGAVVPFVRYYLPNVRLVPIAVSLGSRKEDWDALARRLAPLLGPRTLIVQSTDFSHHLPAHDAVRRDQETLNVLAAGRLDAIVRLRQPDHMDSRGAQYLQTSLQRDVFRASPVVLFNTNAQAFTAAASDQTTSYVVQVYGPPESRIGRDLPGSKVYCFAGDTLFGRGVLRALGEPAVAERMRREIRSVLEACRLIVNLTGVVVPEVPANIDERMLAMPAAIAVPWLKALGAVAVGLANNHTMDLGGAAFDGMVRLLDEAGIAVLRHGAIADLGPFRLAALTDLDNQSGRGAGVVGADDLARLAGSRAKPPLVALVNWGTDFDAEPKPRQRELTEALRTGAVSLIVGVHPHVAAGRLDLLGGGQGLSVHSLGNFLFDQNARVSSGSLLEVRVFDQGTWFARLVPHPNFFERAATRDRPREADRRHR